MEKLRGWGIKAVGSQILPRGGTANRGYRPAASERPATSKFSDWSWHRGQTRIMLATRSPSTRCTSQPLRTASSTRGNRRSQYQQRPLPVEQIACRASGTFSTIRSRVLTALKLTSGLTDDPRSAPPLWPFQGQSQIGAAFRRRCPGCFMYPLRGFVDLVLRRV